eukprot:TRINITY_DN5912_c0_g2_i7.p1 TRINITY_DN5912_c0_g2~~TRINITY_DN5912_c0_g2_i7.p1  ORF type:complete len:431 (-),score=84.91 TRINITY_DN5912_c0_g2_i7:312-1604(-)
MLRPRVITVLRNSFVRWPELQHPQRCFAHNKHFSPNRQNDLHGTNLHRRPIAEEDQEERQDGEKFLSGKANEIQEAMEQFDKANVPEGIQRLKNILKREPLCAAAHCALGIGYGLISDITNSKEHFNLAIKYQPQGIPDAENGLAMLYMGNNEPVLAREHLERALKIDSNHVPSLITLARLHEDDPEKAIESLEKAVKSGPSNEIAHFMLAERYFGINNMSKAIYHIKESIKSRPFFGKAHLLAASLYIESERYGESENHLNSIRKILENENLLKLQYMRLPPPSSSPLSSSSSSTQGNENQQTGATFLGWVDMLMKALYTKAREAARAENWELALQLIQLDLLIKPNNLDCQKFQVIALWKIGQNEEAESRTRTLLGLHPNDPDLTTLMANILMSTNPREAMKYALSARLQSTGKATSFFNGLFKSFQK